MSGSHQLVPRREWRVASAGRAVVPASSSLGGVPMSEGPIDCACDVFGPASVLPVRHSSRWRHNAHVEREADRRRRARHFLAAYARLA